MDMMGLAVENELLKRDLSKVSLHQINLQRTIHIQQKEEECDELKKKVKTQMSFLAEAIMNNEKLIKYYTGFLKDSFFIYI